MAFDLVLKNGEVVFPGSGVRRASIGVRGGRIAAILAPGEELRAGRVVDCTERWVLPGVIDPHTHIGFGDGENDWHTETLTAALGGVTGLLSFWRAGDLAAATPGWIAEAETRAVVDFGLHFGVTARSHVDALPQLGPRFGITSLKVYLMYKGATGAARGFTEVDDALLYRALQAGARLPGGVVGVHCENTEVIPVFREELQRAGRNDLRAWDEQSPGFLETENVFRVAFFGEKAGCAVNIVHMSAGESLDLVCRLRRPDRPPIHVETCAHYLSLSHDAPAGILAKVNPPLRGASDIDRLWEGVRNGEITTVGSDHVARKRATKGPDIWAASAGFPGIAQLLPVLIEHGWKRRGVPIETLAAVTSRNVAALYAIPRKGRIAPGFDADFAIVDPAATTTVRAAAHPSHSDYSPYEGLCLQGAVTHTILRGQVLVEDGIPQPDIPARGCYLRRIVNEEGS